MNSTDAGRASDDGSQSTRSEASGPRISVVVPTHARPERLRVLLDSLASQSLDTDLFEVLIVDDGSPDARRPTSRDLNKGQRLLRQRQAGPAAARNAGAAKATGVLLAFIDDDCVASPGWLDDLWQAHVAHPDALLGGRTTNGLPHNLYAEAAESLLGFLEREASASDGHLDFVASNNLACAREVFGQLSGFDTRYPLAAGEDRAFCRSWVASGRPIVRVEGADIAHCHAHTLKSFWRQQVNYGRGAARFHHGADAGGTVPAPSSFHLRLLLHPFTRRHDRWPRRLGLFMRVLLSQLAIVSGLLLESTRMRRETRSGTS